jgi:hypothetical protein
VTNLSFNIVVTYKNSTNYQFQPSWNSLNS